MDYLQPPQSPDTPPRPQTTLQSPTRLAPKTPIDRGRRPPRLVLPPPTSPSINNASPFSPSLTSKSSQNPNGNPYLYPNNRKQSEFVLGLKGYAKSGLNIGEKSTVMLYNKLYSLSRKWFTHFFLSIVLALYTVGGAALFVYVEGDNEDTVVKATIEARYEVIDEFLELYVRPKQTDDDEWRGKAAKSLENYENFILENYKNKMFILVNHGNKTWTLFNAVVYCSTIFTTIGYGHMYPTTTTGQALTIVYALIGIPLFLIALTDFGKLFTRCIKFVWSFVRRVYYTGSCRRLRKTTHAEDLFQGAQIMYEVATLRRPSIFAPNIQDPENPKEKDGRSINSTTIGTDTPTTPAPSNFEIDDEFNLPISVAIFMLVLYIFLGALMYCWFENWDFFGSFYFVFISMSTIGFGDYVPKHPLGVVLSIVYLVFGLALMSMCINVVQVKLSNTFKDASSKLGATIGLNVNEDDGSITTIAPSPVEVPEVHVFEDKEETNGKDKKNDKNGKKEKKSSLKVSKNKEEKQNEEEEETKPPKEVKF